MNCGYGTLIESAKSSEDHSAPFMISTTALNKLTPTARTRTELPRNKQSGAAHANRARDPGKPPRWL